MTRTEAVFVVIVSVAATMLGREMHRERSKESLQSKQLLEEAQRCADSGGIPFQDVLLRMCCIGVDDGAVISMRCMQPRQR